MFVQDSTKRSRLVNHAQRLASRGRRLVVAGLCALAFGVPAAHASDAAKDFPSHQMRFILPLAPGSAMDSVARYLATELGKHFGETVVVDNRPGGNHAIAVRALLTAPPDGHTIIIGSNSTLWLNQALFKELPYDTFKDIAPVTALFRGDVAYLVPSDSPYKTMGELIEAARKKPGELRFGAAGFGYRLMVENMNRRFELNTSYIPYKSTSDAVTAVASGTVDFGVADISAALGLIQSGKLRPLAVASEARSHLLPDTPTMDESGAPGYREHTWNAASVHSDTPKPIIDKLAAALGEILNSDETKALYKRLGLTATPVGPDHLRELQREQYEELKRTIEFAKIELQ